MYKPSQLFTMSPSLHTNTHAIIKQISFWTEQLFIVPASVSANTFLTHLNIQFNVIGAGNVILCKNLQVNQKQGLGLNKGKGKQYNYFTFVLQQIMIKQNVYNDF